ncbi:hypothetical protein ACFYQA_10000 [Streptomyces sp. NPDC005774]
MDFLANSAYGAGTGSLSDPPLVALDAKEGPPGRALPPGGSS